MRVGGDGSGVREVRERVGVTVWERWTRLDALWMTVGAHLRREVEFRAHFDVLCKMRENNLTVKNH